MYALPSPSASPSTRLVRHLTGVAVHIARSCAARPGKAHTRTRAASNARGDVSGPRALALSVRTLSAALSYASMLFFFGRGRRNGHLRLRHVFAWRDTDDGVRPRLPAVRVREEAGANRRAPSSARACSRCQSRRAHQHGLLCPARSPDVHGDVLGRRRKAAGAAGAARLGQVAPQTLPVRVARTLTRAHQHLRVQVTQGPDRQGRLACLRSLAAHFGRMRTSRVRTASITD